MCNPSGSYKDRFVAAQMREFIRTGVRVCVATSSGNTGAALAAFSSRLNISSTIFVNESTPPGKLLQMQAHGARIFRVRDFGTSPAVSQRILRRLQQVCDEQSIPIVVSAYRFCPEGMRGVEAIATELYSQANIAIDHVFVPVGGGGLYSAVCRGFAAMESPRPQVHAVQPAGCATVVSAYQELRDEIFPVTSMTRISGLSVPLDIDARLALTELRNCGGRGIAVSDDEVFSAQKRMMREEGIWCEPAGAAPLAGLLRAYEEGWITAGALVVCLVTGHGFKDLDSLAEATRGSAVTLIDESDISTHVLEAKV
jgi:threonine synthase